MSFLPDAYRKLRPDGIWIHDLPYWSNALSSEVGRHAGDLLIKYDPRDVSRIFVQHPSSGHFIEARARNLGFPVISLREWKLARKSLRQQGRGERDGDQLMRTALAQRQIVADAIIKTAAARKTGSRQDQFQIARLDRTNSELIFPAFDYAAFAAGALQPTR